MPSNRSRLEQAPRASRPVLLAGRALAVAVLVAAASPSRGAAQGATVDAPVRTQSVLNRAVVMYTPSGGTTVDSAAAGETITVARQAGLALTGPFSTATAPGTQVVFTHQLRNRGTDTDDVQLTASGAPAGWMVALWRDVDGDGQLGPADVQLAGPLTLGAGASAAVLVAVDVPASAANGTVAVVTLGATSTLDSRAQVATTDRITVATTPILQPNVTLTKAVDRAAAVTGDTLHYTITYADVGTGDAADAVIADTLASGLAFVPGTLVLDGVPLTAAADADAGTVTTLGDGRQVVRVARGTVAAGTGGTITLAARISAALPVGSLVNVAVATYADTARTTSLAAASPAAVTTVSPAPLPDLRIAKTAALLDASIGDAVPYAITLRNAGQTAVRDVVVHDLLPSGMRYVQSGLAGADSASTSGGQLTFYVAGPIAPGETRTLRYAAVIASPAPGQALTNRAYAEAEGGSVRTDTAVAPVRLRRSFALRDRVLLGKVWIDRNNDGVQQAGEGGLANAQVWDASGEVVTTDKEGRFSFRDLSTGAHALRLDPLAIPAAYVLADVRDEISLVQADGWTPPRVSIRLVPRVGVATPECECATATAAPIGTPLAPVAVAAAGAADSAAGPTVAPLRTVAERSAAARRELVEGAGLRITSPADGFVVGTSRVYVSVRGVPGERVRLFDGPTLLREGVLRGDGVADFVGVELVQGPHRLRAVTGAGAAAQRWDSVVVHRSGAPERFELVGALPELRADAPGIATLRARVLDHWGVALAGSPTVTVESRGASVDAADADASSVGLQLRVDRRGEVLVPLRVGHQPGEGELRLTTGTATLRVPLRVLPSARPLLATGVGQVGFGAAPSSFGALTLQGALGRESSLSVSYDSRRSDPERQFFQRGYDPLGEERFPTFGDNSQRRVIAPSAKALSARLEHGSDWIAAGDVETAGFGREGELGSYRRALTGVSGRVGMGVLTWHGFASITHQALERRQLRGDGSTGPYMLGGGVRPGTEFVAVEVRARDNAARVVARQQLVRVSDYQIDYTTGAVLLRLPIPSADPYGNPVFVVATVERLAGGDAHLVGGLRLDVDASRWFRRMGGPALDSLAFGVSGVHDGAANSSPVTAGNVAGGANLVTTDVRVRRGGLELAGGVLHSETADSSGWASSATVKWALAKDRLTFDARWMGVGHGVSSAADPRLVSALDQVSIGVATRITDGTRLRLHHDRERFAQYGVERSTTGLGAEQLLAGRKLTQELGVATDALGTAGRATSLVGRATASVTPRLDAWVDGSHSLEDEVVPGATTIARPEQLGAGASFRVLRGTRLEASHRVMRSAGDSVTYAVTSAGLRAEALFGGQVWTALERAGAGTHEEVRASHSALFGWNQRLPLGGGWQLTSLFERRVGLSRASLADPARALPFAQPERDRWSGAAGLAWLPGGDLMRLSVSGELHDGQGSRGSRVQLNGDAAINAGLALLTLNDWSQFRQSDRPGALAFSRSDRSLVGLALRPVTTEALNLLAKVEWRRTLNPVGSALLTPTGTDVRLIGAADAIWAPARATEIAARYALRLNGADVAANPEQRLHVADHFVGARAQRRLFAGLSGRADARLLLEGHSGASAWNAAPSLLYDVAGRLTFEGGYRFGPLRDPDFAATGGRGAFASVGLRFTESSFATPAAFWRDRVANDR